MVTETNITSTSTGTPAADEKYKVIAPEAMHETFMSDSEDEGGECCILSFVDRLNNNSKKLLIGLVSYLSCGFYHFCIALEKGFLFGGGNINVQNGQWCSFRSSRF